MSLKRSIRLEPCGGSSPIQFPWTSKLRSLTLPFEHHQVGTPRGGAFSSSMIEQSSRRSRPSTKTLLKNFGQRSMSIAIRPHSPIRQPPQHLGPARIRSHGVRRRLQRRQHAVQIKKQGGLLKGGGRFGQA